MPAGCSSCSACCFLLEVEELKKPFVTWCSHCRPGNPAGGCGIYADRPAACGGFACLWLASQHRPGEEMAPELRPDRSKVMFGPASQIDKRHLFVHVFPKYPDAWLKPKVYNKIQEILKRGGFVTVVIGPRRVVLGPNQPPIYTTESELEALRITKNRSDSR